MINDTVPPFDWKHDCASFDRVNTPDVHFGDELRSFRWRTVVWVLVVAFAFYWMGHSAGYLDGIASVTQLAPTQELQWQP